MVNYPPNIEQYTPVSAYVPPGYVPPGYDAPRTASLRVRIFAFTFIAVAACGLIYTFAQPAIYLSEATLLTSAPTAIDSMGAEADSQHVAIQRQILLGEDLIAKTRLRLQAQSGEELDEVAFKRQLDTDGCDGVVCINISAGLSATMQSAQTAADQTDGTSCSTACV